jgi:hypothetical protein
MHNSGKPLSRLLMHSLVLAIGSQWGVIPAFADAISPRIQETNFRYSNEKPNSALYGTGTAGRMTEASALRFQGEQETEDGLFDSAIRKLAKAVQLDAADPTGHLLYARALTRKIKAGQIDSKEVDIALNEWKLLWHHDADQNEQFEAHMEARRMGKLAKALHKRMQSQEQMVAEKPGAPAR